MRRWKSVVFASLWIASLAVACSLQDGGTIIGENPDGSNGGDGTVGGDGAAGDGTSLGDSNPGDDSGSSDSGPDGSTGPTFLCDLVLPVTNCQTDCIGFPNNCPLNGTCVSDCAQCQDGGVMDTRYCNACFADAGPAISICEPGDPAAVASCLQGLSRCPCPTNVSECPGPYQTCEGNECFECGEPDASNDNHNCQGGHTCDTGGNAADHLRCH